MAIEKALFLALLVALVLLGQSVAHAEKGGTAAQPASIPSANLGFAAAPNASGISDHKTRDEPLTCR